MLRSKFSCSLLVASFYLLNGFAQQDSTFAERLGFPKGKKVVILHVDDVGMSYDSNKGATEALTPGVASSCSVMMPCPWVSGFLKHLKSNPEIDAGLHLTLTSEWRDYRWIPISGKSNVKGLVDHEGAFWSSVEEVVKHATADEVETEIRAQVDRALTAGFKPTHLDSHMGTLFATPEFTERYIKVGLECKIPPMFPGGHNSLIAKQIGASRLEQARKTGALLWKAGFPVIDDLHNESYEWELPSGTEETVENVRRLKTKYYQDVLKQLKPGLTMVIMHCTDPSEVFSKISDSGITRQGDWLAMTNPDLKRYIAEEGIIITSWREIMQRRQNLPDR